MDKLTSVVDADSVCLEIQSQFIQIRDWNPWYHNIACHAAHMEEVFGRPFDIGIGLW